MSTPQHSRLTFQPLVDDILAKAALYLPEASLQVIQQAYEFAYDAHKGQKRFSGDPYITHPLAAAALLMDLQPDLETIVGCLLHDIPENTHHSIEEIERLFGEQIATLVQGIVDMSTIRYRSKDEMEILKQLGLALIKDIRIVFIKLSERLHNIQTLEFVPSKEKQQRIAEETLYVYAPIANRLGLVKLKAQLEDACFQFLHPQEYMRISSYLHSSDNLQQHLLEEATQKIQTALKEQDVNAEVSVRRKTPYSIFIKMNRKGTNDITEIKDLLAARIIASSRGTCYKVLGIVHQHWTPITSRIKDYIAKPKSNNYQSIHTVVQGMFEDYPEQTLEIQIRSRRMHEEAEYGNAAYAVYKEEGKSASSQHHKWVQTLKDSIHKGDSAISFFEDQIFVLTPDGDIIILPRDATPVDFAYHVNSTMGDTCIAAKVNGQRVTLDYKLETGDLVEIITSQEPNPNTTWLSFVVTEKARTQIKKYLQSRTREELLREGQRVLNEYLKKQHIPLITKDLSLLYLFLNGKRNDLRAREDILVQIATQELSLIEVGKRLQRHHQAEEKTPTLQSASAIIIDGEKNIPYKVSQCCRPVPPMPIIGYTTRGKQVSVHKEQCSLIKHLDQSRILPAQWT